MTRIQHQIDHHVDLVRVGAQLKAYMSYTRISLPICRFLVMSACLLLPSLVNAWTEGLQDAVKLVAAGKATPTQQMTVFVNNTEVNLMAQKGLVKIDAYTTVQQQFNDLNQKFIEQAFRDSGFTPKSSELKLNPGTDTDVNVSSRGAKIKLEDITNAETKYQDAIKDYFHKQPGIDSSKLPTGRIDTNTDFMANPANVDPAEFEKISKHINIDNHGTAYNNPKAASAQFKLGDPAAKLTVEEAGAFSAEIKQLTNAKMDAAVQARKEAAALRSSNPGNAERLEAMASNYEYQAAKYHARLTDVNNKLRGQYDLLNKAAAMDDVSLQIAKIGRTPFTAPDVNMVRSLHAKALQNSADNMIGTMLEIAKKNPASLPEIRQIIAAESKALSATGAAKAATRLEDAVKHIESATKWTTFKQSAKDLSGFSATTKFSAVMTAGGATLIGYQGVQIALTEVKANDTFFDFLKNVYVHAGWEGTGLGPAFEGAQKEEIDKYTKEILAGRNPSMFSHVTFTILKTGAYMGQEAIIGVLTLPDTIWEAFTQEKEMAAYAAMQKELAAAMQQMILDKKSFNQTMSSVKKAGLADADVKPFLNCMCAACGGSLGGIYNPSFKSDIGHGPCQCNGPSTIWKTPVPPSDKKLEYACFNSVTQMRYDEAQQIFDKWHQQALTANAESVTKEFAQLKQEISKGKLENDEERTRGLADQFSAIQPLLLPADADWAKAMISPHLINHGRKQMEAGNLPRAVDDMDKAINKVGVHGAQNEAEAKQAMAQYKAWDPVWKEFKAKRFPEVDALLAKRQIQRAVNEIDGIESQLKDPYLHKLPPATMDPDFLRLKARVDAQHSAYIAAVQDAWKRASDLQKANDPRAAAEVLEKVKKEWDHPQDVINGLNKQIAYDQELVAKALEHQRAAATQIAAQQATVQTAAKQAVARVAPPAAPATPPPNSPSMAKLAAAPAAQPIDFARPEKVVKLGSWGTFEPVNPNMTMRGKKYARYFLHHPGSGGPTEVYYQLHGQATSLTAVIGIDQSMNPGDRIGDGATVRITVTGDGKVLWNSGVITLNTAPVPVNVNLTGIQQLVLKVDDAGDGLGHDWLVWADPVLRVASGAAGPNNLPPVPGEIVRVIAPPVDQVGAPPAWAVGRVWNVTEYGDDTWTAVWTLRKDHRMFDGVWKNQRTGGVFKGELRLVSVDGNKVTVRRDELNLTYVGTIDPDGRSVRRGGRNDFTASQWWSAKWE